jgi:hypothetical protein
MRGCAWLNGQCRRFRLCGQRKAGLPLFLLTIPGSLSPAVSNNLIFGNPDDYFMGYLHTSQQNEELSSFPLMVSRT